VHALMSLQFGDRDDRSRRSSKPRQRACVVVGLFGMGLTPLLLARCDYSAYPIEATFCDDWCFTLRRVPCDQEPENCVRDCEADREPRCAARHEALRVCYAAMPPESFVCVGQGFGSDIRPREGVCQVERDALIGCAAPQEWRCLQQCRDVDAAQPPEDETPLEDPGDCPSRAIPCGNLCRQLSNGDVAEAVAGLGGGLDEDEPPTIEQARAVLECAAELAQECRVSARAGSAGSPQSWQSVLFRCAIQAPGQ
jgi:hypothetical protein